MFSFDLIPTFFPSPRYGPSASWTSPRSDVCVARLVWQGCFFAMGRAFHESPGLLESRWLGGLDLFLYFLGNDGERDLRYRSCIIMCSYYILDSLTYLLMFISLHVKNSSANVNVKVFNPFPLLTDTPKSHQISGFILGSQWSYLSMPMPQARGGRSGSPFKSIFGQPRVGKAWSGCCGLLWSCQYCPS